jgi:uncharacterized membrane protein YkoI
MKTTHTAAFVTAVPALALALALSGCDGSKDSAPSPSSHDTTAPTTDLPSDPPGTTPQSAAPSSTGAASTPARNADLAATPVPVSPEDAVDKAKKTAPTAKVYSVELDFESRSATWAYSIDLQDSAKEYDVKVDASNGTILSTETERAEEPEGEVSTTNPLPYATALKLAQTKGHGRLAGWSLDEDDGIVAYTFEFGDEPAETEVLVNVKTKDVTLDD